MTTDKVTKHASYVNARGETIDNGMNRNAWCSWPHRETCPLCQEMSHRVHQVDCAIAVVGARHGCTCATQPEGRYEPK